MSARAQAADGRRGAASPPRRLVAKARRAAHEAWLRALTALPTAAGREDGVIAWIERWAARRPGLALTRDSAGNLFLRQRRSRTPPRTRGRTRAPLFITAHMDHPAFVVRAVRGDEAELEFRGSVHAPYFEGARLEMIGRGGTRRRAAVVSADAAAVPFTRVTVRLGRHRQGTVPLQAGDLGRWAFDGAPLPRITRGLLYTHACDDLAGVAAALAALDELRRRRGAAHVGVLLTRAEEVGFIGAIAACRARSIPRDARLICLETSRSFAESPIGGGPIVRVGDRMSVFEPRLTNAVSLLMTEYAKAAPGFRWQRKLMPGGTCEATTFSTYGYQSTCLCLPLGNYHNMVDIEGVTAGRTRARIGPEFISVDDFHGLVEMLIVCATRLDARKAPSLRIAMEERMTRSGHVLGPTT